MTTTETEFITTWDMHREGFAAAADYELTPEHLEAPGADNWGEPGCNITDAAWDAFTQTDHYGEAGCMGWSQRHWDTFLDAFVQSACMRLNLPLPWC